MTVLVLRNFAQLPYIPLLNLRPAEMQALEELPKRDKDLLMPFIPLGPWTTAQEFSSSLFRIKEAYGERPLFVTIAEPDIKAPSRPVHSTIAALRDSSNGYKAWCDFIESVNNFVPAIQLENIFELDLQISRLYGLERGIIVTFDDRRFQGIDQISKIISEKSSGGIDVCFLLDFGSRCVDAIGVAATAATYSRIILQNAPHSTIAISASSFPDSFVGCQSQEIFERTLFNIASESLGRTIIYSDRGSTRVERQTGGAGSVPPRVDYASAQSWNFFRFESYPASVEGRNSAYCTLARQAMADPSWDSGLRIWGTQMIERTAIGDTSAITSPKRNTAARINIHLHRQLFYGSPSELYDTDDEWSD